MDRLYVKENKKSLERLQKLVDTISDNELKLVIYKEGWTIASMLGHIAFWDERRRIVVREWQKKGVTQAAYVEIIVNDALIPLLLAIPPRKAAELAVMTAKALDKELAELPDDMVKAIEDLKEPHALDRARHRNMHLDEIDAFLKAKRSKK